MWCIALLAMALAPLARAGGDAQASAVANAAPLQLPHTLDLLLGERARKRERRIDSVESENFLVQTPGLSPLVWPKNSDVRARILTPELKRTPVVGWIAENLYRSKNDNGWCLEVDPGEGHYVVFYRFHPKK
jgi:hypothetical protein